ncbi:MAG: hypothetical protein ACK5M3_13590 [Dysgonomonas sp.]
MKKHYALFFLICCLAKISYAQVLTTEDSDELINQYAQKYIESVKDYAVLFNGLDQPKLINNIKSAYLRKKGYKEFDDWGYEIFNIESSVNGKFDEGDLLYDGVIYHKIAMRLDLHTDELMVLTPNITYRVVLDPERVGHANFNGYYIVYVPARNNLKLPKGYYQQLYSGSISVLRKESFSYSQQVESLVNWTRRYYICKDGVSYNVKNKKAVLKVFKSHKKELDRYIKDARINFNDMESALPLVVEQYDKLTGK